MCEKKNNLKNNRTKNVNNECTISATPCLKDLFKNQLSEMLDITSF